MADSNRAVFDDLVKVVEDKEWGYKVARIIKRSRNTQGIIQYNPPSAKEFRRIAAALRALGCRVEGFVAGIAGITVPPKVTRKQVEAALTK